MDGFVSALTVYPVKSCRGIALDRCDVEARGLRNDRRWMIVDPQGMFVTQRTEPRLALVEVAVDGGELSLRAPGHGEVRVACEPPAGAARRAVTVWRDTVEAIDCGAEAARWVTGWLGTPVALVYMPDDVRRAVNPKYARPDDVVGFADGYPVLVASTSSLDDLSARVGAPVPMDRFRPNVVVTGPPAWAEDLWTSVRVGAVPMRIAKPCSRCVITTTDQQTLARGPEPLRALASFRRVDNDVLFAQNAVPDGAGVIAVGDPVTVLALAAAQRR